ncbi:MAG: CPXCG motif-containing cysteine-rich protein [Xanthomonadales bacterium]|nr:CPXCG motif-containing cysteine-rich protein [Xanthomonadales bacterium]
MELLNEVEEACPSCGEPITLLVDASVTPQSYIEDCEVCCRPMMVTVSVEQGELQVSLTSEAY